MYAKVINIFYTYPHQLQNLPVMYQLSTVYHGQDGYLKNLGFDKID